jgi:hypothetical protein
MKYFKIIVDNHIIGAISSDDFIFRTPRGRFCRTNDEYGELAEYKNQFYHSTWMAPINYELQYIEASVLPITEDEYKAFKHAEESNEVIEENTEEEAVEEEVWVDQIQLDTIEYLRDSKIREMSYICRTTIEAGFDLELRNEIHHFSLDTQDQLNLISLSAMAQTQSLIPYHADGEACIFYTNEEINQIVESATAFKIYHTTYYNALKGYINSLNDINTIAAVEYGMAIPEEYQSDVLKALQV